MNKLTHAELEAAFNAHPLEVKRCLIKILAEVNRAIDKHPQWPKDLIHRAAIVSEESGELIRAVLQYEYEKGNYNEIQTEAIHTAAVCISFLVDLPKLPIPSHFNNQ